MFCPTCGKEIPDSAKFCPLCGENFANQQESPAAPVAPVAPAAPVEQQPAPAVAQPVQQTPVQPVQPAPQPTVPQPEPQYIPQYEAPAANAPAAEKKFDFSAILKNKAVLIGAAAVVVVILLIILISVMAGSSTGGSGNIVTTRYNTFSTDDGIYVFYGDKQLEKIDSDGIRDEGISVNASAMYIYTSDDELYYINGTKMSLVGEYESYDSFSISEDGSTMVIVYRDDDVYVLDYYRNGKLQEAVVEFEDGYSGYKLSPNGDTVLYSAYDDDEKVLYAYNGKIVEIGEGYTPVSVSNGGKIAYVKNEKGHLCYIKNLKEDTEEKLDDEYGSYITHTTNGEGIMYVNDSYNTMVFMPSFDEPVKVSKNEISLVFPANAVRRLDSFDKFLASGDGIRIYERKGDKYEDDKLISNTSNYALSADGSTIVYVDDYELCKISVKSGAKEKVLVEELESSGIFASSDLSKIFFVNEDGDFCCNDEKKIVMDEKDMDDIYNGYITASGVMVFVNDDDELSYSDGGSVKEISEPKEFGSFLAISGDVIFITDDDDEIWISTDGKKFKSTGIEY